MTEEEQQYRDYFETELELDPEDDYIDEKFDEMHIAATGHMNPNLYDFQDYTHLNSPHENYEDIVEQKIFKYKYRQNADDFITYNRRQQRMRDRMLERAKNRDPILEQDLNDLLTTDERDNSWATLANSPGDFRSVAEEETRPHREYMVNESIQQYKDYYESDAEEQGFFEYLDNFTNRDKIRMMEIFEDFTVDRSDFKNFAMIPKREYNPELSVFSNMVLDLQDFRDRVRPLSNDIAMMEYSRKYQKQNVQEMLHKREQFRNMVDEIKRDGTSGRIEQPEEGYSSMEIPEPEPQQQAAAEETAPVEEAQPEPVEAVEEAQQEPAEEKSFYEEAAEQFKADEQPEQPAE